MRMRLESYGKEKTVVRDMIDGDVAVFIGGVNTGILVQRYINSLVVLASGDRWWENVFSYQYTRNIGASVVLKQQCRILRVDEIVKLTED